MTRSMDIRDFRAVFCTSYMLWFYDWRINNQTSFASIVHWIAVQKAIANLRKQTRNSAIASDKEMAIVLHWPKFSLETEYSRIRRDENLDSDVRRSRLYALLQPASWIGAHEWIPNYPIPIAHQDNANSTLSSLFGLFSHQYVLLRAEHGSEDVQKMWFFKTRLESIIDEILLVMARDAETREVFEPFLQMRSMPSQNDFAKVQAKR